MRSLNFQAHSLPCWAAVFGLACFVLASLAHAQEAPRPSLARQRAAQRPVITDYNLKAGPILFRFNTAFRTDYIDNVNLSNGVTIPTESDLIFSPHFGIEARWPITKLNALRFNTTISYNKYLSHPELDSSSFLLAPDSELSFDVISGNVKVNFHDQFSLQEDPVGEGSLSNTAKYGRFTNTAGITVLWDLNDLVLSLGYDNVILMAVGASEEDANSASSASNFDRSTHQISGSATLNFNAAFSAGLEGTASSTGYQQSPENDSTRFGIGPFLNLQVSNYTKLYLAFGCQRVSARSQTGTDTVLILENGVVVGEEMLEEESSGDATDFYGTFTVTHRLNKYYNDRLSLGRQSQLGLFAQQTHTNFATYTSTWQLNPYISLSTSLSFEDVNETGPQAVAPYKRYGVVLSTGYQITRRLSAGLNYQFNKKVASNQLENYTQNRVGISFTYQF